MVRVNFPASHFTAAWPRLSFAVEMLDSVRAGDRPMWVADPQGPPSQLDPEHVFRSVDGPEGGGDGIYRFNDVPDAPGYLVVFQDGLSRARFSVTFRPEDEGIYSWRPRDAEIGTPSPVVQTARPDVRLPWPMPPVSPTVAGTVPEPVLSSDLTAAVRDGLAQLIVLQTQVRNALRTGAPPPSRTKWLVTVLRVNTAGTPVQGPDLAIPPGFALTVRMRRHSGTPNGYIAPSQADTSNTQRRIEMRDNDAVTLNVDNMKRIWADADADTTNFELIVEV